MSVSSPVSRSVCFNSFDLAPPCWVVWRPSQVGGGCGGGTEVGLALDGDADGQGGVDGWRRKLKYGDIQIEIEG